MIALTHALFALLLSITFQIDPITTILFSLTPDAEFILNTFHRGPLHAPILLTPIVIFLNYYNKELGKAAITGIISHLLLDVLTPQGLPLLYPLTKKYFALNFTWNTNALNWLIIVMSIVIINYKIKKIRRSFA